jgi:hypothetical protein
MAGGAQDDDFFLTSSKWWIVGSYTIPRSIFMAPAGRGHRPLPCQRGPSSGTAAEGL